MLKRVLDFLRMLAVAKLVKKDPWLRDVLLYGNTLFNDPAEANSASVEYLQTAATKEQRDGIAKELAERVNQIADSEDRVLACRQWIRDLVYPYSKLRTVFWPPETSGQFDHPCVIGLNDKFEEVIKSEFYDEYRRAGSLKETEAYLRWQYIQFDFHLKVANFARIMLGDKIEDGQDWFRPFVAARCASSEHDIRKHMGLETPCSGTDTFLEFNGLEVNLLKGYKNPIEGVDFAQAKPDEASSA